MNLNDLGAIQKLDKEGMLVSIVSLPDQCQQAWDEGQEIEIPSSYTQVKNIVVAGMGGSALGAHVIKSLYDEDGLQVPLQVVNDYNLPNYVDEDSLVVLSSYSGTTEETLNCARQALEKKAKILGITNGGKLGEFLSTHKLPGYIFTPKHNPCGQPRAGIGYSMLGIMALLQKSQVLTLKNPDKLSQFFRILRSLKGNLQIKAMEGVKKIMGKIPLLVAAEFLAGNGHILANQFNENAKTMSFYCALPEMNHHLLEGLKNPPDRNLSFIFLTSDLYGEKIKKRLELTREVAERNGIKTFEFKAESKERFSQVLETLWFGSFLSFYLAVSYGLDPSPIPWVDFFKRQLEKTQAST